MIRRLLFPITLAAAAAPLHAQSLADAATCERAITGSARDRVAVEKMAVGTTPLAHFAAGCMRVMSAQWDSAAAHFEAAAKGNPRSSAAFLWVANIKGQQARLGDARTKVRLAPEMLEAYGMAVKLDGTNVDAREGLMQFLLATPQPMGGDRAKAAEQAAAIAKLNPYRGIGANIAVAAAGSDRPAVERLLASAITQFPDSALGWANLSALQADAGRASEAFATITRWQARGSHRMFALFSIGRTAAVTGQQLERGEQALKQYLRGPRRADEPPLANANFRLGQIYEKQNRKADARAAYQTALKSNPQFREASMALERVK